LSERLAVPLAPASCFVCWFSRHAARYMQQQGAKPSQARSTSSHLRRLCPLLQLEVAGSGIAMVHRPLLRRAGCLWRRLERRRIFFLRQQGSGSGRRSSEAADLCSTQLGPKSGRLAAAVAAAAAAPEAAGAAHSLALLVPGLVHTARCPPASKPLPGLDAPAGGWQAGAIKGRGGRVTPALAGNCSVPATDKARAPPFPPL
jgi:hypothetical protein